MFRKHFPTACIYNLIPAVYTLETTSVMFHLRDTYTSKTVILKKTRETLALGNAQFVNSLVYYFIVVLYFLLTKFVPSRAVSHC